MQIRYATQEDVCAISAIHTKSWHAAYQGIVPEQFLSAIQDQNLAWEALFNRQVCEQRLTMQMIFDEEDRAAGYIGYGLSRDADRPDWGEILSVYLLPEYFGKGGYAQALMYAALKDFRLCRYKNVLLWVFRANARARRFYEKNGFMRDGSQRTLIFYDTPVKEVRYALSLK